MSLQINLSQGLMGRLEAFHANTTPDRLKELNAEIDALFAENYAYGFEDEGRSMDGRPVTTTVCAIELNPHSATVFYAEKKEQND
jgi:hypothetical protein